MSIGTVVSANTLAVVVIGLFGNATAAQFLVDREWIRRQFDAVAWAAFAVFWANLIEHFLITQQSPLEGLLTILAVPLCLLIALRAWRNQPLVEDADLSVGMLTRAVTVMALLYYPVSGMPAVQQAFIETVTAQVEVIISTLGYNPTVIVGDSGFRDTFVFTASDHRYLTTVLLACTGYGSLSIVMGIIAAVDAPVRKRLLAATIALPVIWGLNLIRVAFITLAHGNQWFRIAVDEVMYLFGETDPHSVSYIWADRIIAQPASAIALVVILIMLMRVLPELKPLGEAVIETFDAVVNRV